MQRSAFCRSRRELSNEYVLAKFGFDTAGNEPDLSFFLFHFLFNLIYAPHPDLGREVELGAKELDALVREEVVVPAPVVDLSQVVARRKAAQQHHRVQVRDIHLIMLLLVRVVLDHHNALVEEVRVKLLAVLLGDKHHRDLTDQLATLARTKMANYTY